MKANDKVTIKQGYGYTDYTTGIQRFCRAIEPVSGIVVSVDKQTVYIKTDDNRKVFTNKNCLEIQS